MNKNITLLLKIVTKIIFGLILFIFSIYIGLWIYTINYVSDDFKEFYDLQAGLIGKMI